MSASPRHLAVGLTLEQAAEMFGELFDDVELTTYANLDGHVDLELLGSLSLVDGAYAEALMPSIVAQHDALGASAPPVYLGGAEGVVETLSGTGSEAPPRVSAPPGRSANGEAPRAPSRPSGTRVTVGLGAAGAAAGGLALLLAAVTGGMQWVLFVLGFEVLVLQVALLAGLAYAIRLLRRHTADDGDARAFRDQMRRRTDRLHKQGGDTIARQRRRFDSVDRSLAELRGTRSRVDALARLVARGRAREAADSAAVSADREQP